MREASLGSGVFFLMAAAQVAEMYREQTSACHAP